MPRRCTICIHPERAAIDRQLLSSVTLRSIAQRFDVSEYALIRHRENHLGELVDQAAETLTEELVMNVWEEINRLKEEAARLQAEAEEQRDLKTALQALAEYRRVVELVCRLEGQVDQGARVNVLVSPEWAALRGIIQSSLAAYPEARNALASELVRLES